MRKLSLIFVCLFSLALNAQVFTHKRILDKFDDVILDKQLKTLIELNDTSITIEEKGGTPTKYIILFRSEENSDGSKDDIVNLTKNVYGYQECWCVVKEQDKQKMDYELLDSTLLTEESKRYETLTRLFSKYCYLVIHRVVVTQYTNQFVSEHIWVQKDEKSGRTVYSYD